MNKDQFAYLNETIVALESQLSQAQDELERLKNCREYQIIKWIDDRILAVWNWARSLKSKETV